MGDAAGSMFDVDDKDKFDFKLINIKHFFNDSNTKNGMRITKVQPKDLDVAEKNEERTNVIQISFTNLSLLWDLDENKEVNFCENPMQFIDYKNFVKSGVVPHVLP